MAQNGTNMEFSQNKKVVPALVYRDSSAVEHFGQCSICTASPKYEWKQKHPQISQALKRGKEVIDIQNAKKCNSSGGNRKQMKAIFALIPGDFRVSYILQYFIFYGNYERQNIKIFPLYIIMTSSESQ